MTDRPTQGQAAPWGTQMNAWMDERLMQLIEEQILSSSVGSINFTSIPTTYESLMVIHAGLQTDDASVASADMIAGRFNNSADSYLTQEFFGRGAGDTSITALSSSVGTGDTTVDDVGGSFNQTTLNNNFRDLVDKVNEMRAAMNGVSTGRSYINSSNNMRVAYIPSSLGNHADATSSGQMIIPMYNNATRWKTVICSGGAFCNLTDILTYQNFGIWRNTSAITQVNLIPNNGSVFLAGARVQLYGIP